MKHWVNIFESMANPDSTQASQAKVKEMANNLNLDWYEFVGRFVKFQYWKWNNDVDLISPETAATAKVQMTEFWIDGFVECPGFAAELIRVGWLERIPDSDLLLSSPLARAHSAHQVAMSKLRIEQKRVAKSEYEAAQKQPQPPIEPAKKEPKKPKSAEPKAPLTLAALRKQKSK